MRLPGPPLLSQLSSHPPGRLWGWRGRPCAFPERLSSFWDQAAVQICPAAAAADPCGRPRLSDRPARRQCRRLPRLQLRPRCRRPLERIARSRLSRQPVTLLAIESDLWREQSAAQSEHRGVCERVRRCEARGQGAAGWRACGARALELAARGNGLPLTGSRRPKIRS